MVEKGKVEFDVGPSWIGWNWNHNHSWFYPFNWLSKDARYLGYREDWYDGPIHSVGCWFFNISWRR